jgi:uncharacterized protein (TIGR00369 family)
VDSLETPLDPSATFDSLYGLELLSADEHEVRASVPVRDAVKQPFGLVHGGVYAAAAEATASLGTALVVREEGKLAVGLSNNTSFLRPILAGTVHVSATRRHRGRTTWIWDVECSDDEGRVCAMSRVTIAVRNP